MGNRKPSRAQPTKSTKTSSPPKNRTRGHFVIQWIEAYCVHTQGEWIGRQFVLLPWQKRIILELFRVGANDLRIYRWALIGVSKKNGKSELCAALALYLLIGDGEPSPLVACAAASEEQADLVFGAAKIMCEMSPQLREITERYDKEILVPSIPGAKLIRVAAAAGTNDGKNLSAVICDELHEWKSGKGEQVWNVLTNGTGARRQPLIIQITTAGFDLWGTVCGDQYRYGKAIEAGEIQDPRYFFYWCEAPEDANYRDPETWRLANPSYGVTVNEEFFADQIKRKPENIFRRYFLNQWTEADEAWLPPGKWNECAAPEKQIPEHARVWIGIDVAVKQDTTAIVVLWQDGATEGAPTYHVQSHVFTPPTGNAAEDVLQLSDVEQSIRELRDHFEVQGLIYDPQFFERSAQMLSDEGMNVTAFAQHPKRLSEASARLYEAVTADRITHDGDPIFARHVAAGVQKYTEYGWRLTKPTNRKKKVDALMALLFVFAVADGPNGSSIYNQKDLLVL